MKGRPLLRPRDEAADEPTHERAEDAYERGGEEPHVIGARHDGPREEPDEEAHDDRPDDVAEAHASYPPSACFTRRRWQTPALLRQLCSAASGVAAVPTGRKPCGSSRFT